MEERVSNEDFNLNSKSERVVIPISEDETAKKLKDTDKVGILPKSGFPAPVEDRNVDTNAIEVLKISVWIKKSEHKVRLIISICILSLFMGWMIAGIALLIFTRNFSLLLYGSPILIPFQRVLAYYFNRPKEQ